MLLKCITALSLILAVVLGLLGTAWMIPVYFLGIFAALFLLAVAFCVIVCACIDMDKPREKESPFLRQVMYLYIDLLIQVLLISVRTRDLDKIPTDTRFLLVCNHQKAADPGILLSCLKKSQLTFISKQENRKLPIINKFMHNIRCQMIDRDNDRQALKAILECIRMIKADEANVAVFPEGYTSRDGKLHHFRPGVFKIAQKANVPIVVCTINGTNRMFDNLKHLKRTRVDLHLLQVIPPEELKGKTTVAIAEEIYETMIADLGEEFRM